MQRTTIVNSGLNARINPEVFGDKGLGGQIDWAAVSAFYFQAGKFIVKLAEDVAIGETAVTIDALPYALKKGDVLDFGVEPSVTVTLTGNEAIGQTDIAVAALSAALPNGAILNFGVNEQMVLTAAAALGATSLTVEALDTAIESGDVATYKGGRKSLTLAADAAAGATTLTVEPPEFAILDNAEAIAAPESFQAQGRRIPANTCMGRTAANKLIPMRDAVAETATEFLVSDADENSMTDAKTGYGTWKGGGFYENLCPDAGTMGASAGDLPSAWKTSLGARFWFDDWVDSRAA